jgi:CheY-like chemotaxis protein
MNKKKTVMVVKNNPQDLWLISCGLQIQGYDTVAVNQGVDAVLQAWNQNVDCVVIDAELNDMSGYEVCTRLRHDEITKTTPIIMVAETDDPKTREKGHLAGASEFIQAPVSVLDMDSLIGRLTQNKNRNNGGYDG